MDKNLEKIIENLKKLNESEVVSIIKSKQNLIVIFKELNLDKLLLNSKVFKKIEKMKLIPVFLPQNFIERSMDVYPLEYLRFKDKYELLYGEEIFKDLNVPLENLRVESEQKLKGVFIRLTQVILEEGKSLRKVLKICFLALDDLLLGIEGVLRIKGVSIFDDEFRCIEKLEEITGFELDSFKEVLKIRSGMRRKRELKSLIYDFYEDVEKLAEFVDRMEV